MLVSFWALAGLVLAGRLGSWGEQFQDPRFVVVMTVLMTLVALNLFGVFEITLGGGVMSAASGATTIASPTASSSTRSWWREIPPPRRPR